MQEVRFSNNTPYKSYRLLFHDVKNNTTANSMQVGEIELLGSAAGNIASVSVTRGASGSLTISSTQPGILQATSELRSTGTVWTEVGAIDGSITVSTTAAARFYRVLVQ